jgi:acetylornithine deacetylase/succinyl-diaminopimelate desuccinylase-like protein
VTSVRAAADAVAAKALLDDIAATPRAAGGEGERRARALCGHRLAAAGFTVGEVPFEYSTMPGRWATPIAGVLLFVVTSIAGHLGYQGRAAAALGALVAGIAAIAAFALWSARRGVLDAPFGRATGINLVATRGASERPAVWLVAHLDSKSQPVPIGVRAAAIVLAVVACLTLIALAVVALAGARVGAGGQAGWQGATLLGWIAAIPIAMTTVGDRSRGALDNASGVVSVMLAAEQLSREIPLGVLLTSAEELGLVGARAWARQVAPHASVALNCDGVDDAGRLTIIRAPGGDTVAAALMQAAERAGAPARIRGLIPGVLVDAVALADAGWQAATVSRGTVRTLLRIHRAADTPDRLTGTGMAEAATVIATAAEALVKVHGATRSVREG